MNETKPKRRIWEVKTETSATKNPFRVSSANIGETIDQWAEAIESQPSDEREHTIIIKSRIEE